MSSRRFILHAHFYQPPRENPWTGRIPGQEGAAPFHDWNARIDDECYRPNAFGRITDDAHQVVAVVNNYEHLSFNVGPTLLRWLAEHDPLTVRRIVEADRRSAQNNRGHGNAIAQAFHHIILPLANTRDRATQIRWGLADFRHRFGREAEAMWLPETAANHDVLDDLIDHQMRFVILAPGQAGRVRPVDGGRWRKVTETEVDRSRPALYRHRDGSGRSLAVFFYDGGLAHALSFGGALEASPAMVERVRAGAAGATGPLVHAATDGETAGHHVAWGDRVLAHALTRALPEVGYTVTNYGALLDELEPAVEVQLDLGRDGRGSSWSCTHGIGRWCSDCGCRIAERPGWDQKWRAPLREALDLLRDHARPWFERQAAEVFLDPWAARDDYVELVLDDSAERRESFLGRHARPRATLAARERGIALMELQHQLMLQYTSCGWFFDDIGGLESSQVLRYAARALQIWGELGGDPPRQQFHDALARARSNDPRKGDGARIFDDILARDTRPSSAPEDPVDGLVGLVRDGLSATGLSEYLKGSGPDASEEHRLELERGIEQCILRGEPGRALQAIEAARDLDFPAHLHRAQEHWLDLATGFEDRRAARSLGLALGLGEGLCDAALDGESWERANSREKTHE